MGAKGHSKMADELWAEIESLYMNDSAYSGQLTQLGHALQTAALADAAGACQLTVVAALLHDVGWKLACCEPTEMDMAGNDDSEGSCCFAAPETISAAARLGILQLCASGGADAEQQRAQHDVIGATFLRMRGFEEKVAHLVEGHVLAKRYLCFAEQDYHSQLSPASVRTLLFQGGPMTATEAAKFEQGTFFELCKQMRRWDEQAKEPDADVPGLQHYKDRVLAAVTGRQISAAETLDRTSFVRQGNTIIGVHAL